METKKKGEGGRKKGKGKGKEKEKEKEKKKGKIWVESMRNRPRQEFRCQNAIFLLPSE